VDTNQGRDLFLKRVLDIAAADPETGANDWFFDIAAMNIYRAPDDIYRIHAIARDLLDSYGLQRKPMWLTETNCMPFDDPLTPKPDDSQRCTLDEQSAFTIQAFAIAYAAGWERAMWYQLTDQNWEIDEAFGLVHDDGSVRPAFSAFKTVAQYLTNGERYVFEPLRRDAPAWSVWPDDPGSYYPAWLIYQVIVDRGDQRVNVLWNGSDQPLRARIPRQGTSAVLVDKLGNEQPLEAQAGGYEVDLAPATAHGGADPDGYYYVGGAPLLIVQSAVPAGSETVAPERVPPS
jgi:hypothetical protein